MIREKVGTSIGWYGKVQLPMVLGEGTWKQTRIVTFMFVDTPSQYNVIMGRPSLSEYAWIISTAHLIMKFPLEGGKQRVIGVGEVHGDQQTSMRCYVAAVRSSESHKRAGEQRSEEDQEMELSRRKEKELRLAE